MSYSPSSESKVESRKLKCYHPIRLLIVVSLSAVECPLAHSTQVQPCVGLEDANTPDAGVAIERKRKRMKKELEGLLEDHAEKSERVQKAIWRNIQKYSAPKAESNVTKLSFPVARKRPRR